MAGRPEDYREETAALAGRRPPGVVGRVDSDRACAILGEACRGQVRGRRNGIVLVVGTGIARPMWENSSIRLDG